MKILPALQIESGLTCKNASQFQLWSLSWVVLENLALAI